MIWKKIITKTNVRVICSLLAAVLVVGSSSASSSIKKENLIDPKVNADSTSSKINSSDVYEIVAVSQKIDVSLKTKDLPKVAELIDSFEESQLDQAGDSIEGFVYSPEIPLSRDLQEFTYQTCVEKGLEYSVVLAIIWKESRFNPNAVGHNYNGTTDNGLMQINDVNRGWLKNQYGITNLLDPEESIIAGTTILETLAEEHGQHYAIMAYKSGEGGMLRSKSSGVTTNKYIENVYSKSAEYKSILDNSTIVDL